MKLFMTLQAQNDVDNIEKHIRFHLAMGVDGVIVTDHRSTDGTRELLLELKKQGLVLEVILEDVEVPVANGKSYDYQWVMRMIELATTKYQADWIINADQDEFYFARSLDLKADIQESAAVANVLVFNSNWYFPDGRDDFLNGVYFGRGLRRHEYDYYGVEYNEVTDYWRTGGPVAIHNTRELVSYLEGGHTVKMTRDAVVEPANITLYHYKIKNYKHLVEKARAALPWVEAIENQNWGRGWRRIARLYQEDGLRDYYETLFGQEMFRKLTEAGAVVRDPSVNTFMKIKGIL